jgi:hypothetical protein
MEDVKPVDSETFQDLFDRWYPRLDRPHFILPLPADGNEARTMTWIHVGSSDDEINARHLQKATGANFELIDWLSQARSGPAYWRKRGIDGTGVRLPIELGFQTWVPAPGIVPEDLNEYIVHLKLAAIGDSVVTVLGLEREVEPSEVEPYELPATLIPNDDLAFDDWARNGAVPFAHQVLCSLNGHRRVPHVGTDLVRRGREGGRLRRIRAMAARARFHR